MGEQAEAGPHVLILEDDEQLREMLVRWVAAAGATPLQLPSSKVDLDAVLQMKFDVLVTDIVMPGADGIEVIRAIRRAHPDLAILAMSGGSDVLPASIGLKVSEALGADLILYKPFGRRAFIEALQNLASADNKL